MSRPRPVTRNPDRTRRRILTAAVNLFARRGLHAVSVDEIVAQARVNKRMVYHYFGSKEALFKAALVEVYSRIERVEFDAFEGGTSPAGKLERLLEGYFAFLEAEPAFTRMLQWENLEKGRHLSNDGHVLSKSPFFVRFRKIVEDGIAGGDFRRDLDVTHLLIHFIGLSSIYSSNRFTLSRGLGLDLADPRVKAEGLKHVLKLVFDGITSQGPVARGRG